MEKITYTREELNKLSVEELSELILKTQEELRTVESKVDFLTEQLTLMKARKFGRSSEKADDNQISFFNEAEELHDKETTDEPAIEEVVKTYTRKRKTKGKREEDLSNLPVEIIEHTIPKEILVAKLGKDYGRFPDSIYRKLRFIPASFVVKNITLLHITVKQII